MAEDSRNKNDDGVELSEEKIKEVQHLEAKQKEVIDSKDKLFGATLADLDLAGLNLQNANLAKANLSHTNLSETNLSNANLIETDFTEANLSKADLHDAYSPDSEWTAVNLSDADLRWAGLNEANFTEATLVASDFTKANLSGANFDNANLIDARFTSVDLSETLHLSSEQVESAEIDRATQLPPYLEINWKGKGEYEVKNMIEKKNVKRQRKNLSVENSQEELASKIMTSSTPT
jgi:hypothetical protein